MRYALLFLWVLVQSGCGGQKAADWSNWDRRDHLGYGFAVPPEYILELSENEIVFQATPDLRTLDVIEIQLGTRILTEMANGSLVEKGTDPAEYVIHDIGGGSGGTVYALSMTKAVGEKQFSFFAHQQLEYGSPNFANAWAVWESFDVLK